MKDAMENRRYQPCKFTYVYLQSDRYYYKRGGKMPLHLSASTVNELRQLLNKHGLKLQKRTQMPRKAKAKAQVKNCQAVKTLHLKAKTAAIIRTAKAKAKKAKAVKTLHSSAAKAALKQHGGQLQSKPQKAPEVEEEAKAGLGMMSSVRGLVADIKQGLQSWGHLIQRDQDECAQDGARTEPGDVTEQDDSDTECKCEFGLRPRIIGKTGLGADAEFRARLQQSLRPKPYVAVRSHRRDSTFVRLFPRYLEALGPDLLPVHLYIEQSDAEAYQQTMKEYLDAGSLKLCPGLAGCSLQVTAMTLNTSLGQHIIVMDDNITKFTRGVRGVKPGEIGKLIAKAGDVLLERPDVKAWSVRACSNTFGAEVEKRPSLGLSLLYGPLFGWLRSERDSEVQCSHGQICDDAERTLRFFKRDGKVLKFAEFSIIKSKKPGTWKDDGGGVSSHFRTRAKHQLAMRKNLKSLATVFPELIIPQESPDHDEGKRAKGPYRLARFPREFLDASVE
jgi:hypothetical protein